MEQCPKCRFPMHPGAETCACGWSANGEPVPRAAEQAFEPSQSLDGSGLKLAGGVLAAAGVVVAGIAFMMKVTVATDLSPLADVDASEVFNTGLMQKQTMLMACGLSACVCGIILFAAGCVVAALQPREG